MDKLIEEFKKEHEEIVRIINTVKELGINSKEGQEKILTAKEELLAHLKKENDKLYPILRKEAEKNNNLKQTLDIFAQEMESVSSKALSFFKKYSKGNTSTVEFFQDYGGLLGALGIRIRKEEKILYSEYEKLIK